MEEQMEILWMWRYFIFFLFFIVIYFQICLQRFMSTTCVKSELDVSGLSNAYCLFFLFSFFWIFLINYGDVWV